MAAIRCIINHILGIFHNNLSTSKDTKVSKLFSCRRYHFPLIFSPLFLRKQKLKKNIAAEIKIKLSFGNHVKHYKLEDGILQKAAIQKIG